MKDQRGWQKSADWYHGWVGKMGSKYHQKVLIPPLISMLNLKREEKLLDLGCGTGVISEYLPANTHYTGVDVSSQMIAHARKLHEGKGEFSVADTNKPYGLTKLPPAQFDAATCLMAIEDMPDARKAFLFAAEALRPGGRLVIMLRHPSFNIPRQSGWVRDPERKLTARRIDSYLTPKAIPIAARTMKHAQRSYHRPLSVYAQELKEAGFVITSMTEVADSLDPQNTDVPAFLGIAATKSR